MTSQERSVAKAGAEMGAIGVPMFLGGLFMVTISQGKFEPIWIGSLVTAIGISLVMGGVILSFAGWIALWDAIGELNIQAAERKARDTEDS